MTNPLRSLLRAFLRAVFAYGAGEEGTATETPPAAAAPATDEEGEVEFDLEAEEGENLFGLPPESTPDGKAAPAKARKPAEEEGAEDSEGEPDEDPEVDPEGDGEPEATAEETLETEAPDDDEVAEVNERWEFRIERAAAAGEFRRPTPQFSLDDVRPTADAVGRFKAALEKDGDDAESQATAIAEIVRDMVGQSIGRYYRDVHTADLDNVERERVQARLDSGYEAFLQTPEGRVVAKDPALKARMTEKFQAIVAKHGFRAALKPTVLDFYKMAGGPKVKGKGGKAPPAKGTPPVDPKAEALAAAGGPRRTRPTAPRRGPARDDGVSEEEAFERSVREDEDLFGLE